MFPFGIRKIPHLWAITLVCLSDNECKERRDEPISAEVILLFIMLAKKGIQEVSIWIPAGVYPDKNWGRND
jgi:hypothetical protein